MKKTTLYATLILLLTIITIGGTYAFFSATAGANTLNSVSSKFEVIYTGGKPFDKELALSTNKEGGLNTTVNIKLAPGSLKGKVDLYINIEKISSVIANDALNWEVYKTFNGSTTKVNDGGTFAKCENQNGITKQCESGDKLYIVRDYNLSEDNTAFTVYIWLNGALVNNDIIGAELKAYIGAESEIITSNFE